MTGGTSEAAGRVEPESLLAQAESRVGEDRIDEAVALLETAAARLDPRHVAAYLGRDASTARIQALLRSTGRLQRELESRRNAADLALRALRAQQRFEPIGESERRGWFIDQA